MMMTSKPANGVSHSDAEFKPTTTTALPRRDATSIQKPKRMRRRQSELFRPFGCDKCLKNYATKAALSLHHKLKHESSEPLTSWVELQKAQRRGPSGKQQQQQQQHQDHQHHQEASLVDGDGASTESNGASTPPRQRPRSTAGSDDSEHSGERNNFDSVVGDENVGQPTTTTTTTAAMRRTSGRKPKPNSLYVEHSFEEADDESTDDDENDTHVNQMRAGASWRQLLDAGKSGATSAPMPLHWAHLPRFYSRNNGVQVRDEDAAAVLLIQLACKERDEQSVPAVAAANGGTVEQLNAWRRASFVVVV